MFVLFLFLGLKLHSNYDLRTGEKNERNQETIKIENQWNSNKISSNKKEGGRYKCEIIKFTHTIESNLNAQKIKDSHEKRVILETESDYEAFLKCDNANYNPNQNNVEIEGTVMNGVGKHLSDLNSDALIVIKNADFKCTSSLFRASASTNNDAQVIHFMGDGIHTITNTDFKWCGKNPYIYQKDSERLLENFDPTLIVFDDSSKNFISGGQFYHSEKELPQSLDISPARCIRTKKTCSLIVSGTYFYNATAYHKGSFFLLDSSEDTSIIHSHFEACYDRENYAHAICANQGMVDIKDCNFNNVLMNPSSRGSIIRAETKSFNFDSNNVKFDNPSINCRCLYIPNSGTYNIIHNEFQNIEINQNGAAIYIDKPSDISFNNNEFDHLMGTGSGHALLLTFDSLEDRSLIGNKFKNIPSADGLIYIKASDEIVTNYTYTNWEFDNIQQSGGGIINVENTNNVSYGLVFEKCIFSGNTNSGDGGAILANQDTFPYCVGLFFLSECKFINNRAEGKGGALAVLIDADVNINSCHFNLNSAENAGAIYIEPISSSPRQCTIQNTNFNENSGSESHAIYININNNLNDDFTLDIRQCKMMNSNSAQKTHNGASCLANCKFINVYDTTFQNEQGKPVFAQSGGLNVTTKSYLTVTKCTFQNLNAGSIEGSYGGGIGYSYGKGSESDRGHDEYINITNCDFINNSGQNGVALLLHAATKNVHVSNINIKQHYQTNYIFCIFFYFEADNELFRFNEINFEENSYNGKLHDGDCGGTGIWIAEAKAQNYLTSITVQFENCKFENNYSPSGGGAFGYDISERLKAVELVFKNCRFVNNTSGGPGGACHFATKKTVELYECIFEDNNCNGTNKVDGGGALEFYSSVELATISQCEFKNCFSKKGSFIYTNGDVRGFNVSHCTFNSLDNTHASSVHLDVSSTARTFIFEFNDFQNLKCNGDYGGSGLHIGPGIDCEINSCNFNGNSGEGQIVIPQSSNQKLIFNNCIFEEGIGGSRAFYIKDEFSVEFYTCTFQTFNIPKADTGRGLLVFSLAHQRTPFFNNCTFTDINCSSALDFEFCKTIQINSCNFTKVQACIDNKGGLLYINNALSVSVTNCMLHTCGSPDGVDHSCFDLCKSVETAEIINCTFEYCGRCANGAAVSTKNISNILIHNSTFLRNMAQGEPRNTLSVYVGENSGNCEITSCKIHSRPNEGLKLRISQFKVFSSNVVFIDNVFDKYQADQSPGPDVNGFAGIRFSGVKTLNVLNNIFETRNTALYVENTEQIDIINNTWQNCIGKMGTDSRAFYIKTILDSLTFRNNTVKNCPNAQNPLMTFSSKQIFIEDCQFIENNYYTQSEFGGGGIGMTFDCTDFKAVFRNCVFRRNHGRLGGALQFGGCLSAESNTGAIELYSCIFENNQADGSGGALAFTSQKNNIVQDCIFNSNSANGKGGAISVISSKFKEYATSQEQGSNNTIINCTFNLNTGSETGHSVFIMNKGSSLIDSCKFSNVNTGGTGGMLSCQRGSLGFGNDQGLMEVTNTLFERTDYSSSGGYSGIEVGESGFSIVHDCVFNNLRASNNGNAINLLSSGEKNIIYENTFNNCAGRDYVICCTGIGIDFHHNHFNCDDTSKSYGFIEIKGSVNGFVHSIHDNYFHDFKDNLEHGKFHYNCRNKGELLVENNIFENLKGKFAFKIEFSLGKIDQLQFNNNTIQNNQPGDGKYLCGFYPYDNQQRVISITNNVFINNTCSSSFGGGIGFWIQTNSNDQLTFQFENCSFEGNHAVYNHDESEKYDNGRGGAVQIGYSGSTSRTSPTFIRCYFINNIADNEGGSLSLSVTGQVTIDNCTFINNIASKNPASLDTNVYGGAIFLEPDGTSVSKSLYSITNSHFIGNNAPMAAAIFAHKCSQANIFIGDGCQFIDNGLYTLKTVNDVIIINSTKFQMSDSIIKYSNPSASSPRAIKIFGQATITNVFFSNIKGNDNNRKATSIYVAPDSGPVEIEKCIFSDCGIKRANQATCILLESEGSTTISNSTFNFTDINTASAAIRVIKPGKISILNNYFTKTHGHEGSLFYSTSKSGDNKKENTIIQGNIFDNVWGYQPIRLYFKSENVQFIDNTIENIMNAQYILLFYIENEVKNYKITHCTFRNLTTSSKYGGGAGLWVQKYGQTLNLEFIECTFENSYAKSSEKENGYGGGFQFGGTKTTSATNIKVSNCVFRGNKADKCGGALSIDVQNDFVIEDCIFESNIAGLDNNTFYGGGALYIGSENNDENSSPENIKISHCTFRNNTAQDANAIYITNMTTTNIYIQDDTIFEDNCIKGKRSDLSALIIDSQALIIDSCEFKYNDTLQSSRAVEVSSITTTISNSKFDKCSNDVASQPNAIWVKQIVESCHIENCIFTDNGRLRGDVIRTETRDFLFENNTIEFTSTDTATRGMYIPNPCKLSIIDSTFRKCRFDSSDHCAAIDYRNNDKIIAGYNEEIRIEGCTFDSNSGGYTSNILLYRIKTFPTLNNLTLKGSTKGRFTLVVFFSFIPQEEFSVENLVFENNYFNGLDGGGSGIWIAEHNVAQTARNTWPLTFNKCTFKKNHAKQSGGALAYGNSNTISFISLTFNECQFIENKCDGDNNIPGGGALWINSQETVNISNCVFTGNSAAGTSTRAAGSTGKGHAIYAAPRSLITVEKCKFVDNGDNGIESVIQMSGQQFNLTNSEISFTKSGSACRGVYIDFPGMINIRNTDFIKCGNGSPTPKEGGAIYYKDANADSVLEEQITIEGCTFDNCSAANGCAMLFWASVPPTLLGNRIINQKSGHYVISIFYTSFQDYSIIENMEFIGGRSGNSEDGGGSSIWIANKEEISNGRPSELIFRNCRWEDNYSPKRGGALHYGNSKTLIGTEITFEDCKFINNRANDAGGAVSIATISPSVFRNCEFNGNIVEKKSASTSTKGSAIYVDSETPLCLISGCTFTNSSADEGNAIFATSKVLALHVTDNTRIRNCGSSGSCIVIESKEFFFLNSQIIFDNINKAARGIRIKTLSVIKISESKFVKCYAPADENSASTDINCQGGAIFIKNIVDTDSQEEVQLLYSTFDGCKAANGCAIMFWIETNPVIKGNKVTNHNYNKYIFTIVRATNFADKFTIENCTFVKNKFSNKNKQDGGGAAIWVANQQYFNEGELAQLLFKDCNWTKNTGVYGGAFSYGTSNTVKYIQLEFQNCHFENNQATGPYGGALYITTVSPITITGCTFYNNKCVNNIQNLGQGDQALGGAIYFDTTADFVNILNTTFRKNSAQNGNAIFVSQNTPFVEIQDTHFLSNSNGNVGAQFAHQGIELRATNTNFDYQVVTLHSKGVDILSKSRTTFNNCNFTLCETPYDKGGALFVQDQLNSQDNDEDLTIEECIFDNCNASEGSAIYASLSKAPSIKKSTIKNNNQGCSVFVFKFTTEIPEMEIIECEFIDNEYLNTEENPDCGGSGIWISNAKKITFHVCDFIRNKADYLGGALAYGHNADLSDISLQFEVCYFEENTCNGKYGGALYLANSETLLTGCVFTNNRPLASNELKGGDIYIDGSASVNIAHSVFQSKVAEIEEGNAIYCSPNTQRLSISDTSFESCGKQGTVIVSNAKENDFNQARFMFEEAINGASARGLAIYLTPQSTETHIKSCEFVNCYFNSQDNNIGGGGLYIKYNGEEASSPKLELDDCLFDGTSATNGAAMYLDICFNITLTAVRASNCVSSNSIVYIKYANTVENTLLNSCQFSQNQLTSSNNGGGSGILISQTQKISFSGCSFVLNTAAGSGGAFACYNGQDAKDTEIEMNGCTFNSNNAQSNGGALYLDTTKPVSIIGCIFDNNTAKGNSGALYVSCQDNIKIELTNIARNKVSSKNAALYINNAKTLEFNNNTISDNTSPSSPSSVEINNEGTANIADNNFDFTRQSDSQYQISLTGSSSSAVCNFKLNCFTHKGEVNSNNLIHILSTHSGQINIPAGNCFDSNQYNSLQHNGGPSSVGDTVFNCKQCGEIYVPTAAPIATPTATRQMTSKPTDIPVPTEKPYIPTPVATPSSGDSDITSSSSSSSSSSSNNNNNNDSSNKGKRKRSVTIAMIAGITAAIVVVICVVIILLWLFIFRKKFVNNNNPQGGMDSNIPSTNDDNISGVSGVNTTPQDDPIWAGATATHDNPLFNGSEDQDDDQMMHTGFEESWGENVI